MSKIIRAGLSDQQNYPAIKDAGTQVQEIYISGSPDLSASLRDYPYVETYKMLEEAGAYNLRLIDGSLVQMLYTFKRNAIQSHRLAIFPAPHLESFDDAAELYMNDVLYSEITAKYLVKFPIRFDFSASDDEHIEFDHPKSHLTLGQYKGCRIPASAPLSPATFMRFVTRHFYFPAIQSIGFSAPEDDPKFADTISENERNLSFFWV
ncbi:DUF2290 domain-containing protein [Methylobacterium sp. OT2]|uniref:DUF2290 domain-containing protein n=1 Tax=Methylobacterium sp. OT2 TaxID=2813779 RepID=UPI00197C841F|nr:DUF2290 domain-containing protein [Methylobacterium sp. OT2]MBN4092706.1 DUF2290 domain-containing protein [Methylobacterium sp. OT2]